MRSTETKTADVISQLENIFIVLISQYVDLDCPLIVALDLDWRHIFLKPF